jgi:uncharacterized protein (DUF1684 family)
MMVAVNALELADWRARVAALYLSNVDIDGFRTGRDDLFRTHAQSPIPPGEPGPRYFDPDPDFIATVRIEPADGSIDIDTGGPDGVVHYNAVGRLQTPWGSLMLWWFQAYGGGLFLPLRDGTSAHETYGGGRYLTDTVKGTHGRGVEWLGGDRVRLDFNYAYNPSCAYSSLWTCPLAPPENRVTEPIRAGELTYPNPS